MDRRIPAPTITAMMVCRDVFFKNTPNGPEYVLIAPTINFWSWQYPATIPTGVFVEFTGGHGSYDIRFELRNVEEDLIQPFDQPPFPAPDPNMVHAIAGHLILDVEEPGRYSLVFLMNGEEVARRQVWVRSPEPSA